MAFAVALVVVVLALGSLEYYTYETMNNQLSGTKADLNSQIAGLQGTITSLRNTVTSLNKTLTSLQGTVAQNQQAESTSAQQIVTLQIDLQNLQNQVSSLTLWVNSTIVTQLQNISATIQTLRSQVTSLQALVRALQGGQFWAPTTDYPHFVGGQSCVASSGYIYCVGGHLNETVSDLTYYAPISSNGVGSWITTTPYPSLVSSQSCVASSGYIYCVGGAYFTNSTNPTITYLNSVYYATLTSSGIGHWIQTTSYPTSITDHSCVAYSGYIYCVGGITPGLSNSVYFAPISSAGVGAWTMTTNYPMWIGSQSCVAIQFGTIGYIYCIGGVDVYIGQSLVYYAPLTSSGVGSWALATSYPYDVNDGSCVSSSGAIYCIGGSTGSKMATNTYYFTPSSSSGIGTWSAIQPYPITGQGMGGVDGFSCVAYSGDVYCVGGSAFGYYNNGYHYQGPYKSVYYAVL
jgi:hypothetical protein